MSVATFSLKNLIYTTTIRIIIRECFWDQASAKTVLLEVSSLVFSG